MEFTSLSHFLPAGNVDRLTGHIARLVRGQKRDHVAYILIRTTAPQRNLRFVFFSHLFRREALRSAVLLEQALLPERSVQKVAGADRVDPNAVGGEIERDALRQADAAEFTRGVGAVAETALLARFRVDLNDRTALLLRHYLRGGLRAEKIADQVDLDHGAPLARGKFENVARLEDARVGDQNIQRAELRHGLPNHRLDIVF